MSDRARELCGEWFNAVVPMRCVNPKGHPPGGHHFESVETGAAPSLGTGQRDQPKQGDIATPEDNFGYEDVVPNRCDKCGEICGLKHVCDSPKADAARIGEIGDAELNAVEDGCPADSQLWQLARQLRERTAERNSAEADRKYLLAEVERLRGERDSLQKQLVDMESAFFKEME